jgi:opacity protein-like surface antigen
MSIIFIIPSGANAQGLEVSAGWAHVTQDFGMDGFTLGASYFVAPRLSLAANYDDAWDTSRVGAFEFTSVGAISAKSHIQDFLIGPRVYFAPYKIDRHNRVIPFADARFGISHLHQEIQEGITAAAINQDSAFSWMIGGGVDYPLGPHWMARGELGLLRTHLNADAQSRARLAITIAYTFGSR